MVVQLFRVYSKSKVERKLDDKYPWTKITKTRKMFKIYNCLICKKKFDNKNRIHKSHTIPQRNLNYLKHKNSGTLLLPTYSASASLHKTKKMANTTETLVKTKTGISDCMTFKLICSKCDVKYFQNYENDSFVDSVLNDENIVSMALKTFLYTYYIMEDKQSLRTAKKLDYDNYGNHILKTVKNMNLFTQQDTADYFSVVNELIQDREKGINKYVSLFDTTIDHRVPIAAHTTAVLYFNPNGKIIQTNTLTNYLEELIIVILPDNKKSRIVLLTKKSNNVIINQWLPVFRKMTENEKLKEVYFILLMEKDNGYVYSKRMRSLLLRDPIVSLFKVERPSEDITHRKLRAKIPNIFSKSVTNSIS